MAKFALLLMAGAGIADQWNLICENPGQEYQVTYSTGAKTIQLSSPRANAEYRVLAVEKTNEKHMVVATTVNGGPTARLNLRPYLKMEYWSDGQLTQTDGCYRRK